MITEQHYCFVTIANADVGNAYFSQTLTFNRLSFYYDDLSEIFMASILPPSFDNFFIFLFPFVSRFFIHSRRHQRDKIRKDT